MEHESTISRIYGLHSHVIEAGVAHTFRNQEPVLKRLGIDIVEEEKTPEEKEIISLVNFHINQLTSRTELGELSIPEANIHILPTNYDFFSMDGKVLDGITSPINQAIIVSRNRSNLSTASILFHEMIHLRGHTAFVNIGGYLSDYRSGLEVVKNNFSRFHCLNEAVTEELTREFILRYHDHPLFRNDIEEVKTISAASAEKFNPYNTFTQDLEKDGLLLPQEQSDGSNTLVGFAYPIERNALNELIDRLHYFNPDRFKTRKQIFNKFVNGLFTGHIYELGKLIDGTFGKGTFRKIGEIEDSEKLLSFAKTLQ